MPDLIKYHYFLEQPKQVYVFFEVVLKFKSFKISRICIHCTYARLTLTIIKIALIVKM